jgi:hypothetical protein
MSELIYEVISNVNRVKSTGERVEPCKRPQLGAKAPDMEPLQ